jgi:hypothetical protein
MIINHDKLDKYIAPLFEINKLKNLVEIDLGYTEFSQLTLRTICRTLNPIISGYCAMKRLVFTNIGLGKTGIKALFQAIECNEFIEEVLVSGNNGTDDCITEIVSTLLHDTNKIRILCLGGMEFTEKSMESFGLVFKKNDKVEELQLNNNSIGDIGTFSLFDGIRDNNVLLNLNLSNCNIIKCTWASKLRIMTNLVCLDLSYNNIDDEGLEQLCDALGNCYCIRHIDLSNNKFGGLPCLCLRNMIEANKCLMTLKMKYNSMLEQVWENFGIGLKENKILLQLDISYCGITMQLAEFFCQEVMKSNKTCSIIMDFNYLDLKLQIDSRKYENESKDIKATTLIDDAAGISLRTGVVLRNTKIYQLQLSKEALAIVDMSEKEKKIQRLQNKVFSLYENDDKDNDDYTEDLDCNASVNISPGGQNLLKAKGRLKLSDDISLRTFGGKKVVNIGYGYKSLIIGSLELTEQTNYDLLRIKIKPLIESYLASNTSESMENEINNFMLLDPNGIPVEGLDCEIRTVWREFSTADDNDFIVLVRPATWLHMQSLEDDDDYENREDVTSHY